MKGAVLHPYAREPVTRFSVFYFALKNSSLKEVNMFKANKFCCSKEVAKAHKRAARQNFINSQKGLQRSKRR
jgi:hypothetical protein